MKLKIQVDGEWITYDDAGENDAYDYWFQMGKNVAHRELRVPSNQQELPDAFWDGADFANQLAEMGEVS